MSNEELHAPPDWLIRASKAKAVTGAVKDRAVAYMKENQETLSPEAAEALQKVIVDKPETESLINFMTPTQIRSYEPPEEAVLVHRIINR